MNFYRRAHGHPKRLAVFPGTFNPVTVAHRALARAALAHVDEVVLVLPRIFPHKEYCGAPFEARLEMLCAAVGRNEPISVAASEGGLFVEIAAECRTVYGRGVALSFLCGRDAAERIAGWDYGRPEALVEMLRQFDLLVAARQGEYRPPAALRSAFHRLDVTGEFDCVSASEVRARIARGEAWEHLVPPEVHAQVRKIYR
jgi:nicotinate (nicotinamide) nucleotide adenylyltransferase